MPQNMNKLITDVINKIFLSCFNYWLNKKSSGSETYVNSSQTELLFSWLCFTEFFTLNFFGPVSSYLCVRPGTKVHDLESSENLVTKFLVQGCVEISRLLMNELIGLHKRVKCYTVTPAWPQKTTSCPQHCTLFMQLQSF